MNSKKYIESILYSLIFAFLLMVTLEFLLRKIPNVYKYKSANLQQRAGDIKGVILGSSHAYYGVNPEYISSYSFSVANVSQDFNYDYYILNKNIEELKNLEFVILPLSIFSLYSELDVGAERWRIYNYRHWFAYNDFSFDEFFNIKNYSVFLASPDKISSVKRVIKYYLFADSDQAWSKSGWGTNYNTNQSEKELLVSGKVAAKRHQATDFNERSLDSLEKIIRICDSKNIKLLVITTPEYFSYRENLDEKRLTKTIYTISELLRSNKNAKYINYMADGRFIGADFYDADHLNHKGSEKFSIIIDGEIKKMLGK